MFVGMMMKSSNAYNVAQAVLVKDIDSTIEGDNQHPSFAAEEQYWKYTDAEEVYFRRSSDFATSRYTVEPSEGCACK